MRDGMQTKWMRRGILGLAVSMFLGIGSMMTVLAAEPAAQPLVKSENDPMKATPSPTFSAVVADASGNSVTGYRGADGITYLFLPQNYAVSSMEVHLGGTILSVSKGTYDSGTGVLSGAFKKAGDSVEVQLSDGTATLKVMQSSIPSLQIKLGKTTLAEIQKDKEKKHGGNAVTLTEAGQKLSLSAQGVEIKGRGNTSWSFYDKKGYQLKFDDKVSVLGMKESKKWVLLANGSDDSMMRNMLAMDLARSLGMPYTPTFRYVDLWIDSEYLGTYLIGDKIEIGKNRINLKNDDGILMELDDAYYAQEDYWFHDVLLDQYFTVKEAVNESDSATKANMAAFQTALDQFINYLYQTPADQITLEQLGTMIDVDSFAKYYLVAEYTLNREASHSSCYWYKDGAGDVLHMGPVWDYDTCMGNEQIGYKAYYATDSNVMFNKLLAAPAFYNRVMSIKKQNSGAFSSLTGKVSTYQKQIASSAEMNYIRWNTLGTHNQKGDYNFAASYAEAVSSLKSWLSGRSSAFAPSRPDLVMSVSEDGSELIVTTGRTGALQLGVWGDVAKQADLKWYTPTQQTQKASTFRIPMSVLGKKGIYYLHLYRPSEEGNSVLTGSTYYRY